MPCIHRPYQPPEVAVPVLTPRMRQVLLLIAAGATRDRVARELGVFPNTVKTHVSRLLRALKARDAAHAVAIAIRMGLVCPCEIPDLAPMTVAVEVSRAAAS